MVASDACSQCNKSRGFILRLKKQNGANIENSDTLFQCLNRIWNEIDDDTVLNLTRSMRRRVQALINAQGGHTKY